MKKIKSFYQDLGQEIRQAGQKNARKVPLAEVVRQLRAEKKLTGAELCRKSGLDPRTLTAFEKGRIRNPSLETLEMLAAGLGMEISGLFRQSEIRGGQSCYAGTPKGLFQMDFPAWGIKVVSLTPLMPDFFCGKFIFAGRKRLEGSLLPHDAPLFVSVLVGSFEASAGSEKFALKEGDNFFIKGGLDHSLQNQLQREGVLLAVMAPSFLGSRESKGLPIFSGKR